MAAPTVSVIIPTYNRRAALETSIASVLRQSVEDLELIVVDDCSTDDTPAMLGAVTDRRVRAIRHEANRGANAARNSGLDAASGRFVAFQDSDDEWLPAKLEKQLAALAAGDAVAAYCGMIVVDGQHGGSSRRTRIRYLPDPARSRVSGDLLEPLLTTSLVSTQTFIGRRDVIREAGRFDEALPALQDWDFMLRVAKLGPIALVDEPLVIQHLSPDSITRSPRKRVEARARIVEKNMDLLSARPDLLATHHQAIGSALHALGDVAGARRHLLRALRLGPFSLRRWGAAALTLLGKAGRRLRPQ